MDITWGVMPRDGGNACIRSADLPAVTLVLWRKLAVIFSAGLVGHWAKDELRFYEDGGHLLGGCVARGRNQLLPGHWNTIFSGQLQGKTSFGETLTRHSRKAG